MSLQQKIKVVQGDITKLVVDVICNAANETLLGGGGVDGAIHKAAGKQLLKECKTLGGCECGHSKITKGYNLPASYVIHTVGPQDKDSSLLADCYKSALELMKLKGLRTIAFPCISTGVFGYPNEEAAFVAFRTVVEWLSGNEDNVDEIIFCTYLDIDKELYDELLYNY